MKKVLFLIIIMTVFSNCKNSSTEISGEINQIIDGLDAHNSRIYDSFTMDYLITPKRFEKYYFSFNDFVKKNNKLNEILDNKIDNNSISLEKEFNRIYQEMKDIIDSIYRPIVSCRYLKKVEPEYIYKNYDETPEIINLTKYFNPIEDKIKNYSSSNDIYFIQLYLILIEREVLTFLIKESKTGDIPINRIKPITTMKDNVISCYIASVDTFNYPIIYIGKSEEYIFQKNHKGYKMIEIIDTIYFTKESAEIKIDYWKKYDAILEYKFPNGAIGTYKLE
jgi:hypothetical protein